MILMAGRVKNSRAFGSCFGVFWSSISNTQTETYNVFLNPSLEINIFSVPDTVSCTSQFVTDVKENVLNLYWTITVTGCLFQGLKTKCVKYKIIAIHQTY